MTWVLLLVALGAGAAVLVTRSRRRVEPGMATFRRHIDALSPEARREVVDRVNRHRESSPDDGPVDESGDERGGNG